MAASEGVKDIDRAPGAGLRAARWRWRGRRGGNARMVAGMVAALAYYYLVPNPLLALPGLVAFAALAWPRLELAICLLPLTFPFWYVPKRALGQAAFPLSEIALGICLAVAVGQLLLGWVRVTGNTKKREVREEGEQIRTAADTEGAADRRGYTVRRERAKEQPDSAGSGANVVGRTTLASSATPFFASFADLHVLRVPRILTFPQWRWLVIGAALLLVGTAVGVLIAVRPREALRAFRWEVAEPMLYATLVIVCLWRRFVPHAGDVPPDGSRAPVDHGERSHSPALGLGWLAGPVLAVGALFGVLAIAQVLWLRVTFTPLAAGNHLVALPATPGGPVARATGIYYGSANSLGALLERVLPLALALLLWRLLEETEDAKSAKDREEGEHFTTEEAEGREGREVEGRARATAEAESASATVEGAADATVTSSPPGVGAQHAAPTGGESETAALSSSVPPVSSVVHPSANRGKALLLAGCVLVMVIGLALSGSRGAEVGAAAGALLVLLAYPRTRRVALGIVLLGVVVALWQVGTLMQAALVGHGGSGEVRLLLWQSALHMIRDHPLLGIGPDQFLYYYDPAYTAHPYWIPRLGGHLTPAAFQPDLAQPHNLVLDLWLSGGVLALAGFTLLLGWLAWSGWRVWRASLRRAAGRWTARTALVVGVAGGLLAGLTHGMVDSAYFQPDLALLLWWAVAVVVLLRMESAGRVVPGSRQVSISGAA